MMRHSSQPTPPSTGSGYSRVEAMSRIERTAAELGVAIMFTLDLPDDWLGAYRHRDRCVLFRPGMDLPTFRSVAAHEFGHAYYGHECSSDPVRNWRQEAMADAYAARLLVDKDDYRRNTLVGRAGAVLASTLSVLPWVVEAFPTAAIL